MVFRYNTINWMAYELTEQTNVMCGITTCTDDEFFTLPEGVADMRLATILDNPGTIDGEQEPLFFIKDEAVDADPKTDFREFVDVYMKNLNFVANRDDLRSVPSLLESTYTKIVNLYMNGVAIKDWVPRLNNEQMHNSISQTDLSVISLKNVNVMEISLSVFEGNGRVSLIINLVF